MDWTSFLEILINEYYITVFVLIPLIISFLLGFLNVKHGEMITNIIAMILIVSLLIVLIGIVYAGYAYFTSSWESNIFVSIPLHLFLSASILVFGTVFIGSAFECFHNYLQEKFK